ncbi:transposase, partial [Streptomyces scopuliridis]
IEGTINQALDVTGLRRARYRGLSKVRLQHAFSATAVNVIRLDAHWNPSQPSFTPRTSRLTRLSHRLAAQTPKGAAPALGPRNTRLQRRLARS